MSEGEAALGLFEGEGGKSQVEDDAVEFLEIQLLHNIFDFIETAVEEDEIPFPLQSFREEGLDKGVEVSEYQPSVGNQGKNFGGEAAAAGGGVEAFQPGLEV